MKIKIELDSDLNENEIIIRCPALTEEIQMLQQVISDAVPEHPRMTFYKGNVQYFLNLEDILFFETEDKWINVHTAARGTTAPLFSADIKIRHIKYP